MKSRRKIAIFLRKLTSGGAERVMLNLASGLIKQGFAVDFLLAKAEGDYLKLLPYGAKLINFDANKFSDNTKLLTGFQSFQSIPKLVNYLRRERPDVLLSATHFSNEAAIIAKCLARVSTKLVVSEHITLSIEAKKVEQVSSRLTPLTARWLYPFADRIITVSQGVAQDLHQLTGIPLNRMEVIYNPVITPTFAKKLAEPLEHPWFALGEPPVIVAGGRFVGQKDFTTLIRSLAKVRAVKSARLIMLGSGREEEKLKALVKKLNLEKDVAWTGFVDNPLPYLKRGSVFVLSSIWEGLPTILIEAMATGISIVSTDCPSGPREILKDGEYGELVPVSNPDIMAEAILRGLSEKPQPVESTWLSQFTLETATQKYLQVLGLA